VSDSEPSRIDPHGREQRTSLLRALPLGNLIADRAWTKLGVSVGLCLLLVLLPLFLDHVVISNVVLFVAIYALLSLGLNVVMGYTGLLELGYVMFLATGAIVTFNLLLLTKTETGWVLPVGSTEAVAGSHPFAESSLLFLGVILFSGAVCALLGFLRGIPTVKLTGDYYAIVTLGLAEIVYLIYLNWTDFTGGAFGMKLSLAARPTFLGDKLYYDTPQFYYLVLFALGMTIVIMDRLDRSRLGRAWAAIRLDEVAARASGIDVARSKMIAFSISGFFGGVGGSLYAIWIGTVASKSLDVWQSILILCAVVLGGMGSIRGVLLGSLILFPLRELLRETIPGTDLRVPPEASNLVYGLLLILVMRFRPQGLLPRSGGEGETMDADEKTRVQASTPRLFVLREGGSDSD
jgi:branched-chain amino acid transport system permease protein